MNGSRLAAAGLTLVALVGLSACGDSRQTPTPTDIPAVSSQPVDGGTNTPGKESTSQGFTGEVNTEKIRVGPMEVEVPKGLKIPESTLVTDAKSTHVMMGDQDPQPVTDMIKSSAKEAGYEVYATPTKNVTIFVGQGNAVLFEAGPGFQILTWGPEAMKDVLAQPPA